MNIQELQNQVVDLQNQVAYLNKVAIQLNIDPTARKYLETIINALTASAVASAVATAVATLPSQTYSLSAPSGSAPQGSLWMKDTGVLATNEIHVYSGAAWIRMK